MREGDLYLLESEYDDDLKLYVYFSAHVNSGLYLNTLNAGQACQTRCTEPQHTCHVDSRLASHC